MDSTFGNIVLTLFQIIDGSTLSYGYSNMPMSEDLRQLQIKFRNSLVNYLDKQDSESKQFLELCVNHIEDIINENLGFLKQDNQKPSLRGLFRRRKQTMIDNEKQDLLVELEQYSGLYTILRETEKYLNDHIFPVYIADDVKNLLGQIKPVRDKASVLKAQAKEDLCELL